jgi:iron complex transport system substrate-binding protein
VGVDRYSNWPPRVSKLPKAGGFEDVQVEQIVALHPEVVLAANVPRVLERLRALGVTVFEFEAQSFDDIARNVSTLGALLGVPLAAERLNRQIEESVAEVASAARRRLANRAPRVYYEVDPSPYGAGPKSFIGEMLARLGARNILTADLGPFPHLNPEYVVSGNPDVIVVAPDEVPRLSRRPGWDQIRAVREGRICSFSPQVDETIVRPGPRVGEGLEALAECLFRVAP